MKEKNPNYDGMPRWINRQLAVNNTLFKKDFKFIMQEDDMIVTDGPHGGIKQFIGKYLKDHPNNRYGKDVESIFNVVHPILVSTPSWAGSINADPNDALAEIEFNSILYPNMYTLANDHPYWLE